MGLLNRMLDTQEKVVDTWARMPYNMQHDVGNTATSHTGDDEMTYHELAMYINTLTEEQMNMDVTVYLSGIDEYYGLDDNTPVYQAPEYDVLDQNHPYLVI